MFRKLEIREKTKIEIRKNCLVLSRIKDVKQISFKIKPRYFQLTVTSFKMTPDDSV